MKNSNPISTKTQELLIQEKLSMINFLCANVGICLKLREKFSDDPELVELLEREIKACEGHIKHLYSSIQFNQEMVNAIKARNKLIKRDV